MKRNPIETLLGVVVLIVAALFLAFAYNSASLRGVSGYTVSAAFNKVGGLTAGSDVRISGIKVGAVREQSLDGATYQAVVTMSISPSVRLPSDTVASIASDGLLGEKYVKLAPGASQEMIGAGGMLKKTKDFQSVEDLVGELIFLATRDDGGGAR